MQKQIHVCYAQQKMTSVVVSSDPYGHTFKPPEVDAEGAIAAIDNWIAHHRKELESKKTSKRSDIQAAKDTIQREIEQLTQEEE